MNAIVIQIKAKSVYGQTKLYPANAAAECLAKIAGTTTLTEQAISEAKRMGCTVVLDGDATIRELVAANHLTTRREPQHGRHRKV